MTKKAADLRSEDAGAEHEVKAEDVEGHEYAEGETDERALEEPSNRRRCNARRSAVAS